MSEVDDELERDTSGEDGIGDSDVDSALNELSHGLLEVVLSSSKTDLSLEDEVAEGLTSTDGHGRVGKLEAVVALDAVNELLESLTGVNIDVERDRGADGALRVDLVLESVGVDTSASRVGHVVLEMDTVSSDLEGFVDADGRDDGVGGGDGGDDALNDSLSELEGDSSDLELLGSLLSTLVDPSHVHRVVLVELDALPVLMLVFVPLVEHEGNAVLRLAGGVRQRAHLEVEGIRGVQAQRALQAGGHARQNDTRLSLQRLRSSIDQGDDGIHVGSSIIVDAHQGSQHGVDPATSLDGIQTGDDQVELLVELTRLSSDVRIVAVMSGTSGRASKPRQKTVQQRPESMTISKQKEGVRLRSASRNGSDFADIPV